MSSTVGRYTGTKIVAVAKNYAKHKVEMGGSAAKLSRPSVFLKPNSTVITAGWPTSSSFIIRPKLVTDLHHEVELGVVINSRSKNIKAADWQSVVGGYCVALDMTARDLQAAAKAEGMPWTLGKCWDTFCVLGPTLGGGSGSTSGLAATIDPHNLELWLEVNGKHRQRGSTSDMMAKIPELIEFISSVMTLEAGDVILTGTPEGVGPVVPGDVITAGITSLPAGNLKVGVVQEK